MFSDDGHELDHRFRYSGAGLLEEEATLEEGFDSTSPGTLLKRTKLLKSALEMGVPLGDGLAALGLLVEQLEAVCLVDSEIESRTQEWQREIHALLSAEPLSTHVAMLPATQQWSAWTVLDLTHAGTVADVDSTACLERSLPFVAQLGSGGGHTLAGFAESRFAVQVTEKTAALAEAIDRALPLVQDEETLVRLKSADFEFGIQYARAMRHPAPADERLIGRLELLSSELTLRFGGDVFCADPSGMDDASKEQLRSERHELLGRLNALVNEEYSEAWTHGFVAFVKGRIFLGTGELERGRQAMQEAMDLGFCPWQAGLHWAYAATRIRLRDEVRQAIETLATRCLVKRGTLQERSEAMARLYFQVGGNPDKVGSTEWPVLAPVLTENRKRRDDLLELVQQKAISAQAAFHNACLHRAEVLLGETLTPEDVDAYLRRDETKDRFLRIPRGEASAARLDELPMLKISPQTLGRAVERGVGSHDLTERLLAHVHSLEEAGEPLERILPRFPCLAASLGYARAYLEEVFLEGIPAATEAFRVWVAVGQLPEPAKVELHGFVRQQLEARGAGAEAASSSEWFAQQVAGPNRGTVLDGVLPGLYKQLGEAPTQSAQLAVVDRILELAGDSEEAHGRIVDWAAPLVLTASGAPSANRQTQELLEGLSSRVRYQPGKVVRGWMVDVLLERLATMGLSREAVRMVEHVLPSCVGEKALEQRMVDWYMSTLPRLSHADEVTPLLDITESLLRRFSMKSSSEIREGLGRHAERAFGLAFAADQPQVRDRLEGLVPGRVRKWGVGGMSTGRWAGWIAALVVSIAFAGFVFWKNYSDGKESKLETPAAQAAAIHEANTGAKAPEKDDEAADAAATCQGLKLEASQDGRFLAVRDATADFNSDVWSIFDLSLVKSGSSSPIWRMAKAEAEAEDPKGATPLALKKKEWAIGELCLEPMPDTPEYRVELLWENEVCAARFLHKDQVMYQEVVRGLKAAESLCKGKLQVAWHWYYSTAFQAYLVHMVVDSYTEDYSELISLRNAFAFSPAR